MYREAIYHPDLSIFKTLCISLPFPFTHTFEFSPPTQVLRSSEDFFISTCLDEHSEIKMEEEGQTKRIGWIGERYNDGDKEMRISPQERIQAGN